MDKSVYSNGLEPQSPDPFLPPLSVATCVASPTIDQSTQSSRPLSESKIKAAIKNVAKAGYLHISTTTIHLPDQALQSGPQQSDKVKTSSSSKKRKREEQGVPNENKKVKKQAVPMREQSSRYDTLDIIFIIIDTSITASRMPTTGTSTSTSAPVRFSTSDWDDVMTSRTVGRKNRLMRMILRCGSGTSETNEGCSR
jgi:hypothetical protein